MTISEQTKIDEHIKTVNKSGMVSVPPTSIRNIKQSSFQSMLLNTIENSQFSIAQQSRMKNSEARYSTTAQPKLSAQQSEASRLSAAKVASQNTAQPPTRTNNAEYQHNDIQQQIDQSFNALDQQNFDNRLEMKNHLFNADVHIDYVQGDIDPSVLSSDEVYEIQKNKNSLSLDADKEIDSQLDENNLTQEATIQFKNQHSKLSTDQNDLTVSERNAVNGPEQSAIKLVSLSTEQPRELAKSIVNIAIHSYVGSEQWGREVRQKIVWMFGSGQQSATLTLNPPNLGPLHVSINMQNNVAHTTFRTNDPGVRQALAQGLVLLNDMMSQRGLVLGNTTLTHIEEKVLSDEA